MISCDYSGTVSLSGPFIFQWMLWSLRTEQVCLPCLLLHPNSSCPLLLFWLFLLSNFTYISVVRRFLIKFRLTSYIECRCTSTPSSFFTLYLFLLFNLFIYLLSFHRTMAICRKVLSTTESYFFFSSPHSTSLFLDFFSIFLPFLYFLDF